MLPVRSEIISEFYYATFNLGTPRHAQQPENRTQSQLLQIVKNCNEKENDSGVYFSNLIHTYTISFLSYMYE